jgi:hypothetical protein
MYTYDPKFEKEIREKLYTYSEVYLMMDHVHKKNRRNKYWTVFVAGIWTPVITLICMTEYSNPAIYLIGAVSSTFVAYVWDETYETAFSYVRKKMKETKNNDTDKTED